MINKVTLIGHLGRDPELRRLENGAAVAKFSVATNENYQDKSGQWQSLTEWHDIIMWRNLAERAEQQLKKGHLVYIEGKITSRTWQDQDGNNRKTTEIVANSFRLLTPRGENSNSGVGTYFPSAEHEPANSYGGGMSSAQESSDSMSSLTEPEVADDLPF